MTDRYMVFTDLDGTLLDHHTYSYKPAINTLNRVRRAGIPIILTTSKTASEVSKLHRELALDSPFIVENGAAIHFPESALPQKPTDATWRDDRWQMIFTHTRHHWINLLERVAPMYEGLFTCFSRMSTEQIVQATGLDYYSAERAAQREFTEPVLWLGNEHKKNQFIKTLQNNGANVVAGGRFLHVSGDCNKGKALQWLMTEYAKQIPDFNWKSIALGDSDNDIGMLEAACQPICIRSPVHAFPKVSGNKPCIFSQETGPQGWAESLDAFLFNQQ